MRHKKMTANTVDEVRCWVETTAHHKAGWEFDKDGQPSHLRLTGSHETLRIPVALKERCFLRGGDAYDSRMYRWDHHAERRTLG